MEGYEIQPAHCPLINTRRDSRQLCKILVILAWFIFACSLFLSSHSSVLNLSAFFVRDGEGCWPLFQRRMYAIPGYWSMDRSVPAWQEWIVACSSGMVYGLPMNLSDILDSCFQLRGAQWMCLWLLHGNIIIIMIMIILTNKNIYK